MQQKHLTCTSTEVWALQTEPLDFYPRSHQKGRAPLSVFVAYLANKQKKESQSWQNMHNKRHGFATHKWPGLEQCPTFENGNSLGLHHEKGQQMENDIRTRGGVVLEAHTGHQVNEESIALLPEPSMLVDKNPTQNKRAKSWHNTTLPWFEEGTKHRAFYEQQNTFKSVPILLILMW